MKTPLLPSRPAPKGNSCLCSGCGELFNSPYAFDMHRTGEFADHRPYGRRCLTTDEMLQRGMIHNARGLWITESHPNDFAATSSPPRPVAAGPSPDGPF